MAKYMKRPVVIDAVQYTGTPLSATAISKFVGKSCTIKDNNEMYIETLEGTMHVSVGDYVIRGVHGEFYPCKPDIFHETYISAEEGDCSEN